MLYKFELQFLDDNKTTKYKTLREISKELNIEYFQTRCIFAHSMKPKKYLHPHLKSLCSKYKIITNPDLFP
jgi:hypothetical protein